MKSEIKLPNYETIDTFPCLGMCKYSGYIVLFTADKVGFIVNIEKATSDQSHSSIGDHSNNWAMNQFVKFLGKVELSN